MNILDLTTFDQLRGVLTVSKADLPDKVLAPYGLEDDLQVDLDGWLENWQQVRDSDDRPATLLRLYAKYRCAGWVAASGQNFTLTQFSDGANQGQRSDTEGFQKLREHMEGRANHYRQQLETLIHQTTATVLPVMGIASPGRDPVTEGR